ncbi:Protein of unknown function [Pyronema omphalodes CBS 100304]|uniref:Uncharacterized protein n=1 Tax=Pyronema omphalodes (strain CBS 100304) TaxID=1076935 RepID=U4LBJ8_PYROM|nr:Protein of unknown function [Pyronema omphalodes CBS 100304]
MVTTDATVRNIQR